MLAIIIARDAGGNFEKIGVPEMLATNVSSYNCTEMLAINVNHYNFQK